MKGIRFYRVIWIQGDEFYTITTAAHSKRYVIDKARNGDYGVDGELLKVQEVETPLIDMEWLIDLFTSGSSKTEREAHVLETQYVLKLVENFAARIKTEDGEIIER